MNQLDLAVFLVAGVAGFMGEAKIAWGVIAAWSLLKLLHVL